MPRYDFRCESCGLEAKDVTSPRPDFTHRCPDCNRPMKRLFPAPAVIFKGSGFYNTDSR